jgi:hypothetical protein
MDDQAAASAFAIPVALAAGDQWTPGSLQAAYILPSVRDGEIATVARVVIPPGSSIGLDFVG